MPENKSQHFVPQHYLRQFRIQGTKQICTARLEPLAMIGPSSIRYQCKEDYFYREDGNLDDLLTQSEQDLAPVIHFKTPSVTLPRTWSFCRYRRHRKIGDDNRRDPAWTALIDRLMKDMDENPLGGDIFDRLEKILGAKIKNHNIDD